MTSAKPTHTEEDYIRLLERDRLQYQPWLATRSPPTEEQQIIQSALKKVFGANIGANCFISSAAHVLATNLRLGNNCVVAAGAVIRDTLTAGNDVSINSYAQLAGSVTLGDGVRIAGGASLFGFNHEIKRTDIPIKDQPISTKGIKIGAGTWIGANAVIVDGVSVGRHCVVAAGAVVTRSCPDYVVLAGVPARAIKDRKAMSAPIANSPKTLPVRELLFKTDPYVDLHWRLAPDLQGWGSSHEVFRHAIGLTKPRLIVEVGTWKGASAIHMAKICKELGLQTEIVCVDTWLGNWQHWSRNDGVGSIVDLRLVNGFPTLYFQFMNNVVSQGFQETITPLPLTGVAASHLFKFHKIRPDIVYIDGDHEYESVIGDLRGWLGLLADDGILIGDDIKYFEGVRRAVSEIVAQGGWKLEERGEKFTITRVKA